jgi:LytS/YehU family sensor histidine kinase
MQIDPETFEARVPNLILQPIVENAIRHGIIGRAGRGLIEISACRSNGMLQLRVRDNGPGLSAEVSGDANKTRGLGFALTKERLERLYAGEQKFLLDDVVEGGLQVTLEFPFKNGIEGSRSL